MQIRPVSDGDLAAVAKIALANDEHKAADPRYVRHQSAHGRFLVAADDGDAGRGVTDHAVAEHRVDEHRVVGYGAVRRVGDATMLCDLFIDPARHGGGTGKLLLGSLLDGAAERFTFASKDPRAMPLYARHGMAPRWPLLYLSGPPGAIAAAAGSARAQQVPAGRAAAAELQLTGLDRGADYDFWAGEPGGAAVIVEDAGTVVAAGAVTTVPAGGTTDSVCHLTTGPGRDPAGALAAVLAFLATRPGPDRATAELCLPGPHPALSSLLDAGWRIDDYDHHMASSPDLLSTSQVPSPSLG